MKHPKRLHLDFAAAVNEARGAGLALLAVGLLAVIGLGLAFAQLQQQHDSVQARLDALPRVKHKAPLTDTKLVADLATVQHELMVPWTPLLNELEAANHDLANKVSILSIAPDPAKHTVRVVAEVRELPDALELLERLQQSKLLKYPMLESHERRKDDPEHPIRIKLSAEWRT
jgi:hypothetical protein